MMSTLEKKQEEAFDELTEVIQQAAADMPIERCSCCSATARDYLRIYLCDKHMNKYGEIKNIK